MGKEIKQLQESVATLTASSRANEEANSRREQWEQNMSDKINTNSERQQEQHTRMEQLMHQLF